MPPPTATQKPNKAATKESATKPPAASANGVNGAAAGSDEKKTGFTKPDQAKYNAEQDEINKEIAALKTKMVRYSGNVLQPTRLTNRTLSRLEFN